MHPPSHPLTHSLKHENERCLFYGNNFDTRSLTIRQRFHLHFPNELLSLSLFTDTDSRTNSLMYKNGKDLALAHWKYCGKHSDATDNLISDSIIQKFIHRLLFCLNIFILHRYSLDFLTPARPRMANVQHFQITSC
jgi:hypothetical protein